MKYLKNQVETSIIINKSEFIAILYPIETDEDISHAISDAKKRYPKATHYVTSQIRGKNGEYASSNDDGEPARTAGFPSLEILLQHQVTDLICIIVRYFGGIKLGGGGLVRAYRKATIEVLEKAIFYQKKLVKKYRFVFPYHLIDTFEHLLTNYAQITSKEYLENVCYELIFLEGDLSLLNNIKHQIIEIIALPEEILNIDIN